jgi:hypothetical protein
VGHPTIRDSCVWKEKDAALLLRPSHPTQQSMKCSLGVCTGGRKGLQRGKQSSKGAAQKLGRSGMAAGGVTLDLKKV